ncbi:hypothetical protein [Paenibacillus puerhi]|uniref:hypothetical protein n=1 Tax=Paenibacillus puerhi TaxID=2692622 RepID=UPI00135B4AFA|nr:hypothetical protein [Paenibacillus puerhi]
MKRIYPITEEECKPHCGKPVLILMQDGTEIYGTLSRVEGGKLYLGEEEGGESAAEARATARSKAKKLSARTGKKGKARVSGAKGGLNTLAYPYGPTPASPFFPGGGRLILDLALIALLFVLI